MCTSVNVCERERKRELEEERERERMIERLLDEVRVGEKDRKKVKEFFLSPQQRKQFLKVTLSWVCLCG